MITINIFGHISFIHSPFYVYAYAFEIVWSIHCIQNMRRISDFHNKYIELLSSGGSQHYQYHLKKFDLDPQNKDFGSWERFNKIL